MKKTFTLSGLLVALTALPAMAQDQLGQLEVVGKPVAGKLGFQPAVTELSRDLQSLDHMMTIIITAICVFVTALLVICIVRLQSVKTTHVEMQPRRVIARNRAKDCDLER